VEVLILDDFLIRPINPDAASDTLAWIHRRTPVSGCVGGPQAVILCR